MYTNNLKAIPTPLPLARQFLRENCCIFSDIGSYYHCCLACSTYGSSGTFLNDYNNSEKSCQIIAPAHFQIHLCWFAEMGSINIKDSKETRNHCRHLKKQTNRKNSGEESQMQVAKPTNIYSVGKP